MELICVTFNCGDDWNAHMKLFDYGYQNYDNKCLLNSGIIEIDNIFYESTPYLIDNVYFPIKENEKYDIYIYLLNDPKEDIIGKVVIYINKEIVYSQNIYRYY